MTNMTDTQWARKAKELKTKIKGMRLRAKDGGSLSEKLEVLNQVKLLEAELQHHRLNYFDLTAAPD